MDNIDALSALINEIKAITNISKRTDRYINIIKSAPLRDIKVEVNCSLDHGSARFDMVANAKIKESILEHLRNDLDMSSSVIDKGHQGLLRAVEGFKTHTTTKEGEEHDG